MIGRSPIRSACCVCGLIAVLISVPSPGAGQAATEHSARATVDSFFAAIAREKWDSAATMLDLKLFESFFKSVVGSVRGAIPQRPMTVEDLMSVDSTMPRAVAEWQIGQMKKNGGGEFDYLTSQFAGITGPRDLFALTIPVAASRWLEAQDVRTQERMAWQRQGCPLSDLPTFPATRHTVLATGVVDDSTVYVVYTDDRFGGPGPYGLGLGERLIRLRRTNGRWLIEPRQDLLRPDNVGFGFDCPKVRHP